jgi:hypothetical protein
MQSRSHFRRSKTRLGVQSCFKASGGRRTRPRHVHQDAARDTVHDAPRTCAVAGGRPADRNSGRAGHGRRRSLLRLHHPDRHAEGAAGESLEQARVRVGVRVRDRVRTG